MYAALGIPEYWLVDGLSGQVTILTLCDGLYEEAVFWGDRAIASPRFPDLELTAAAIFAASELPDDAQD